MARKGPNLSNIWCVEYNKKRKSTATTVAGLTMAYSVNTKKIALRAFEFARYLFICTTEGWHANSRY